MSFRSAFVLLLLASACGSSSGTGPGDGGIVTGPGTPAGPVTLPDGTTVPAVSCGDENIASASGTWDVVTSGAHTSGQGTAAITIDATSFVVVSGGKTLSFSAAAGVMTLNWTDTNRAPAPIAITHADSPIDTGLLLLPVGGQWTFKGEPTETCSASLTGKAFNTTCNRVHTPLGKLDGTAVGIRQQQHPSLFGELGGTWHLTGAGPAIIDATISGNTFTAVVKGDGGPVGGSGWVTVKVCNGAAAGKSSSGLELAATRQ